MRLNFLSFIMLPAMLVAISLAGCAMQRAVDAESAQRQMLGMTKEKIFACMGIPRQKAAEGNTEIWSYRSGNGWTSKNKRTATTSLSGQLGAALSLGDEVKEKRFCTVQIVMNEGRVQAVHYNGPTGGFLTEDEQCAYAIRNCI